LKYKFERIKKNLKNEVMKIITNRELKDPRIPDFMTITRITISKDLHYCHLYFSMIGDINKRSKAVSGLNSASGFIQKRIADRLALKYTPKIEFRYDKLEEEAHKLDKILDTLSHEREFKDE
jgi:ribosome-binding factor A